MIWKQKGFMLPHKRFSVIRLWQHELEEDFDGCIDRIIAAVRGRAKKTHSKQES